MQRRDTELYAPYQMRSRAQKVLILVPALSVLLLVAQNKTVGVYDCYCIARDESMRSSDVHQIPEIAFSASSLLCVTKRNASIRLNTVFMVL